MGTLQQIQAARTDMTDYVVHLTRDWVDQADGRKSHCDSFERLKEIIRIGSIKATRAPRVTVQKNINNTIRGPYPAVCFTEQPLAQIPVTLALLDGTSYKGYGVALEKTDLYKYGGRKAIENDSETLNDLSDERKYLWVCHRLIHPADSGYPNDFTWEREWRSRVKDQALTPWGRSLKKDELPILLPDDFRRIGRRAGLNRWELREGCYPRFRIIVAKDAEVKELREHIDELSVDHKHGYYPLYLAALQRVQIISMEHVERRLAVNDPHYLRIEDLAPPAERRNIIPIVPKKKVPLKKVAAKV